MTITSTILNINQIQTYCPQIIHDTIFDIFRHHHMSGLDRHKCNHTVETGHENISLLIIPDENNGDGPFKCACNPNTLFMALKLDENKKNYKGLDYICSSKKCKFNGMLL